MAEEEEEADELVAIFVVVVSMLKNQRIEKLKLLELDSSSILSSASVVPRGYDDDAAA